MADILLWLVEFHLYTLSYSPLPPPFFFLFLFLFPFLCLSSIGIIGLLHQVWVGTRLLKNNQFNHHTQAREESILSQSEPVGVEIRPASHLTEIRVGAEGNGNGIGHQQKGQQQLEGRMTEQLLDVHLSDEFLHIPGILEGDGRPSFRQVSPRAVSTRTL